MNDLQRIAELFLWAGGRPTWTEFTSMDAELQAALATAGKRRAAVLAGLSGVAGASTESALAFLGASMEAPQGEDAAMEMARGAL